MNLKEHTEELCPHSSSQILADARMLTTVYVERLTKLVEVLKNTDPKLFCMNDYESLCGTIHCAAGWAWVHNIGDVKDYKFWYNSTLCLNYYGYSVNELAGGRRDLHLYMFGCRWNIEEPSIEQAIQRIERVIHEFERTH